VYAFQRWSGSGLVSLRHSPLLGPEHRQPLEHLVHRGGIEVEMDAERFGHAGDRQVGQLQADSIEAVSSSEVATPAFTLPAPDSTNTASRPAIAPRQNDRPPICCAAPDWSER
jgi:hypothetical protein